MGHAFQQTLMDALIRYHRMRGFNTNWVVGTDHAGIATQIVVERQLEAEGKTRHDLGREKFVERVWEWKQQSGSTITRQMRRLGASANWEYADTEGQRAGYFTMDAKMSRAVVEVFVRLYEEGLIYRGKRLVNWDPVLGTAVSDLEVDTEEEDGTIWQIRYPLEPTAAATSIACRHDAARDHARRHRGRGASRRRALPAPGRQARAACRSPTAPSRSSPTTTSTREFGTGCGEDHARARLQRLRGRRCATSLPLIVIFTLDAKINENGAGAVSAAWTASRRASAVRRATSRREDFLVGAEAAQADACRARAAPARSSSRCSPTSGS